NVDVMLAADWIIDLGPGAGDAGGQVVAMGTPQDVAQSDGLTARYLREAMTASALGVWTVAWNAGTRRVAPRQGVGAPHLRWSSMKSSRATLALPAVLLLTLLTAACSDRLGLGYGGLEGRYRIDGSVDGAPFYRIDGEIRIRDQRRDEARVDIDWI